MCIEFIYTGKGQQGGGISIENELPTVSLKNHVLKLNHCFAFPARMYWE